MFRLSIAVLLLLATSKGMRYPHYEQVFRDPASYDMLYSSTSGPINETWYFSRSLNLTGLVLPSQIVSYCRAANLSEGSWDKSPYAEDLEVSVLERNGSSSRLVAVGRFVGNATPGEELRVALAAVGPRGQPADAWPPTVAAGTRYTIRVAFSTAGLYPWYLRRGLDTLSPLTEVDNQQGFVIGLSFVLV